MYVCNKCSEKYDDEVVTCEKCGGFGITFVDDDEAPQLFAEIIKEKCQECGTEFSGSIRLEYSRRAKIVFIIAMIAPLVAFLSVMYVIFYILNIERIPLKIVLPAAILPFFLFSAIGTCMKKDKKFKCEKCNAVNLINEQL